MVSVSLMDIYLQFSLDLIIKRGMASTYNIDVLFVSFFLCILVLTLGSVSDFAASQKLLIPQRSFLMPLWLTAKLIQ